MADIHDLAAPYALDALNADETRHFEEHLAACPTCRAEVVELREAAAEYAGSVASRPPTWLKERVLAAISDEPAAMTTIETRRRRTWVALSVAAALVLIFAGIWASVNRDTGDADLIAAVHEAADVTFVDLDTGSGPARFAYSPSLELGVFDGRRLDEVDETDLYQLWLIGPKGPQSAGTFQPDDGEVLVTEVAPGLTLAVTIEAAPGTGSPTSEPLFATELGS